MILKQNKYNFSFTPIRYEFENAKETYDANFLVIKFNFCYQEERIIEEKSEFTSFEMFDFITNLEKSFELGNESIINMDKIEPCFSISVILGKINYIKVHYVFDLNHQIHHLNFSLEYSKEEIKEFIKELKTEYERFPYRKF